MSVYKDISEALSLLSQKEHIPILQRFFKTGKGEYGEGDVFIGIKVPEQRTVAKSFFKQTTPQDIEKLLSSAIHEYRLTALFILTLQYQAAHTLEARKEIFDLYIANKHHVNNWDLVDSSTHKIIGPYVHETQQFDLLYNLAEEENMWSKRIAVVSLWYLWKKGYTQEALRLLSQNLQHPHDLMHKANGWMLRELGKIDLDAMLLFLEKNYHSLPRTTLRYAIEKLDTLQRKAILKGEF
jgi:3-methyladenine DNA glycosylase AlkD